LNLIRHIALAEKAVTDELTGAYDKELLALDLEREAERARRFNQYISLVFIDIDDLKKINDSFGHEEGTKLIQFVSDSIKQNLRKFDTVYRYGGDEFVMLLPGADPDNAAVIVNRIRNRISTYENEFNYSPSISAGICSQKGKKVISARELINNSDSALYQAKPEGKGRLYHSRNAANTSGAKQQTNEGGEEK